MPRIDPLDLLKCLGVLLSPTGGIKGPGEVERVARLMLRFSKKLVSKCIYIHVLKATPSDLLDSFLNQQGAWYMIHTWLADAVQSHNTPLMIEVLELLQLCPVNEVRLKDPDINALVQGRFKYGDVAHMVQAIAQEYNDQNCRNLAAQLWSRWYAKPVDPTDFVVGQEDQVNGSLTSSSILPDDIDLSIYAPDVTAPAYADMTSTMSNLSTLDMSSYAPYMGQGEDYFSMNTVEPVAPMNAFMTSQPPSDDKNSFNALDQSSGVYAPVEHAQPPAPQPQMVQQQNSHVDVPVSNNWTVPTNSVPQPASSPIRPPMDESVIKQTETSPGGTGGAGGLPVLKIKMSKVGQPYVISAEVVDQTDSAAPAPAPAEPAKSSSKDKDKDKDGKASKDKKKSSSSSDSKKSSSSSSSSKSKEESSKRSSSSDGKKDSKDKDRSKSSKSSSSSSKSSSSKDKSKSSSSKESSDKKSKPSPQKEGGMSKEARQAEENRKTLAVLKSLSSPAVKLAKIPRKPKSEDGTTSEGSQPSSSLTTDMLDKLAAQQQRPKTVKTFNSKFRSTGLVEEVPPVPKKAPQPSPAGPLPGDKKLSPAVKRSGPADGVVGVQPAEKKLKAVDDSAISAAVAAVMKKTAAAEATKPAVKLISARPRPLLQDSSLFMDALEAGAKTEPRKRKRSSSTSTTATKEDSPAAGPVKTPEPAVPVVKTEPQPASDVSPKPEKPMFKFYQDTLETDEAEKKPETPEKAKEEEPESMAVEESAADAEAAGEDVTPTEAESNSRDGSERDGGGTPTASPSEQPEEEGKVRGVLVIHSQMKNRKKKSVRWRAEEELEMHHFFELDETERVNVNKLLFVEMKQAEREREKQAVKMSKHMVEEVESEEPARPWPGLIRVEIPEDRAVSIVPGHSSKESEIQAARESATLQALYFKGQVLPDSPIEPDPEVPLERTDSAPAIIPLDDVTGNPENLYDYRHLGWPEPRTHGFGPPHSHGPGPPHHLHQPQMQPHPYQQPNFPPSGMQPFRSGPIDHQPYVPDQYGGPDDIPPPHHPHGPHGHHAGPGPSMHHPRGGHGGPRGGGDVGGTWMAGDGSVYPDHDVGRFNDGPPHHRDGYHHRDRDVDRRHGYDSGYGGGGGGPVGGYMGPPRGMGMDGPPRGPRFNGPARGRGGPRGGGGGGPSNQPCWHFMRGFCRLENRCKFLHINQPGG